MNAAAIAPDFIAFSDPGPMDSFGIFDGRGVVSRIKAIAGKTNVAMPKEHYVVKGHHPG